jgi:hypothetical protein
MFSRNFITQALEPAAAGNPTIVSRPMLWADHFMIHDIGLWNVFFATVQLLIAVGLFWRPTARLALGASVAWALGVWWIGEGLGGVLSGATPVAGYPGGVILYALVAVLLWPRQRPSAQLSVAQSSPLGRRGAEAFWVVLWGGFAYFALVPANRSSQGLSGMMAEMAGGEPGWIGSIDRRLASALAHHGTEVAVVLALACVVIAVGLLIPVAVRPILGLAIVLSVALWVAQDFGGIFTGTGTDVNTAPLLALLAAAYWPLARLERSGTSRLGARSTVPVAP